MGTVNVGVVVLFGDKHRPHSLRVLMPSGKEYVLQKIKADPEMKEASPKGAVRSSTGSANKATVAQSDSAVKYSDRASDGSQLSAKWQSFFRNSKVRDEQGRLPVMYHGTNTPGFAVFNPKKSDNGISLFFTDSVDVTDSYGCVICHQCKKREPAALLPKITDKSATPTGSTISIAELLDHVNQHFPDIDMTLLSLLSVRAERAMPALRLSRTASS